jgi:AcrR family transcriptional regulator
MASKASKPQPVGPPPDSRKGEILNVAAQIFQRKGFHATSIQEIADKVGMLKGSLYYYISTKDDLLIEIIDKVHIENEAYMADLFESSAGAAVRLREFIRRHVQFFTENHTWVAVYLHEYKAVPPELRSKYAAKRDHYERKVVDIIEQGQREGVFRVDIDSRTTTRAILGMCNWMYHWHRPQGGLSPEQLGAAFADLMLQGIEVR